MENPYTNKENRAPKFTTPQEEISYLREQVARKERELESSTEKLPRQNIIAEELRHYQEKPSEKVLVGGYQMKVDEIEETVLHLTPEHDRKIDELVVVMETKGIKNALSVVAKLKNPHITDDFHRLLVQYFMEIGAAPGIKEGAPLFRALRMKLFEITLLKITPDGGERHFKELVAGMEQFYAGMLSLGDKSAFPKPGEDYFTIEIARSNFEEEIVFYCAIPRNKERLFEKQLLGVFPDARIKEHKEDYNPFNTDGVTVGSYARPSGTPILPIKMYDTFEYDPLNIILSSFSKMKKEGEGAAIQFIISPVGDMYNKKYNGALEKIKEGKSLKESLESATATTTKEIGGALKGLIFGYKDTKKDKSLEMPLKIDEEAVENISEKVGAPIFETNIRIISSAPTKGEAEAILGELESAFNQFLKPNSNGIDFVRESGKGLLSLIHNFTFRLHAPKESFPLNTKELTTLFHFPVSSLGATDLKEAAAKQAPAPSGSSKEGVLLGINEFQSESTEVHFGKEDRVRHFYVIGQTGTGKTSLLKNMIIQDIENGDGVCMIDPHGTDIVDILANIPKDRIDDVIYFDPAYTARPMGLNMLEYDPKFPEQKTFVVNELFSIFQKLYAGSPESMGPMFEQYFRNATLLVIEDPSSGSTLLDVSRVLSDKEFRTLKLSRCKNPIVKQFWEKTAGEAGGEAALENIVPYITSKFDVFMANDIMRPIIAQEKSAFNFRQIMDERKILLVNLSKGRLGDINSNLIGLILVGKILMAALSRVDAPAETRHDFYLYIDEFQNITTDSIATILSEARKYRLGLNIAHQFIAQLEPKIRDAVFGNVGSIATFRVGSEDAEFLEKQLAPTFTASDIMNLENHNAYLKLLVDGQPQAPFNIKTIMPSRGNPDIVENIKQLSYLKYGKDREVIEKEIMEKFGG